MQEKRILEIFTDSKALLTGHFKLTSGLHSNQYFQCAQVLQYPKYAEELCSFAMACFENKAPTTVIAPAVCGIVVGQETARLLNCRSIFAERQEGVMTLRLGFTVEPGEKVLVVEDVVTTGGSVKEVVELVRRAGGEVVGVFCIVDRSGGKAEFGVPFVAAFQMEVVSFPPESCPLCAQNLPIVKPGSRGLK